MVLAQPVTNFKLFLRSSIFNVFTDEAQAAAVPDLSAAVQPVTPPSIIERRLGVDVAGLTPYSVFAGLANAPRLPFTVRGKAGHDMVDFMRSECTFVFYTYWKNLREAGGVDQRMVFTGEIVEVTPQPVSPRAEALTSVVVELTGRYIREESTDNGDTWTRKTHIDVSPGVNTWFVNGRDYYEDYKNSATGQATAAAVTDAGSSDTGADEPGN